MNHEIKPQNPSNNHKGLEMYFSPEIAEKFAELEQNEKNFKVAQIVDTILLQESAELKAPIYSAELGGGAHPDRYDEFFSKLVNEGGHMDWVDVAPLMLDLAKKYTSNEKYQNRKSVITFIKSEILEYLRNLENEKLDLAIMKYTIDHIESLDDLFKLLSIKLTQCGKLIATIGSTSPELKSHSTNARFLYNGEQFPDNETRTLKDGDNFTVKFFKVSGDPTAGYLEGAETLKYYHSAEKIRQLANSFGFDIFRSRPILIFLLTLRMDKNKFIISLRPNFTDKNKINKESAKLLISLTLSEIANIFSLFNFEHFLIFL